MSSYYQEFDKIHEQLAELAAQQRQAFKQLDQLFILAQLQKAETLLQLNGGRQTAKDARTEIHNPWAWSSGPVEDKRTSEPLIDRGRQYTEWHGILNPNEIK